MRRLAAIAILFMGIPAFAGSYDDFARGIDANNRGRPEAALVHFTHAIEARDLAGSYQPGAYLGRARAYLSTGRCKEAANDLSDAIRLKPDYIDAFSLRADARHCLGDDAAALKDADAAIRLKPAAGYFFMRARLYWLSGQYADAHEDAMRAAASDPANGYFVLWAAMTALRTGHFNAPVFDRLAAASETGWPRPLIDLYAGRTGPADVRRAAGGDTALTCEADFYIGQWQAARGERQKARDLFQRAANECPHSFIAKDGARHELERTS